MKNKWDNFGKFESELKITNNRGQEYLFADIMPRKNKMNNKNSMRSVGLQDEFDKLERSTTRAIKWGIALWIAGAVVSLMMSATIIYVVVHFVMKYWN